MLIGRTASSRAANFTLRGVCVPEIPAQGKRLGARARRHRQGRPLEEDMSGRAPGGGDVKVDWSVAED
jgi:hypothetical protein